jgi:hypothetical protein
MARKVGTGGVRSSGAGGETGKENIPRSIVTTHMPSAWVSICKTSSCLDVLPKQPCRTHGVMH